MPSEQATERDLRAQSRAAQKEPEASSSKIPEMIPEPEIESEDEEAENLKRIRDLQFDIKGLNIEREEAEERRQAENETRSRWERTMMEELAALSKKVKKQKARPPGGDPGSDSDGDGPNRRPPRRSTRGPSIPSDTTQKKSPKINSPDIFDGKPENLNTFIKDCKLYLLIKADTFDTEDQKMAFILSFCRGPIINDWVIYTAEQIQEFEDDAPRTADELLSNIKEQFGDIDEQVTAQQKLDVLKQTTTAEIYVIEFRTLARKTKYDEQALIAAFRKGINPSIVTKIFGYEHMPTTLEQWYRAAIKLDKQFRDLQQIKRTSERKTGKGTPSSGWKGTGTTSTTNTQQRTGGGFNKAKTPEEIERYKKTCEYCKKFGHTRENCRRRLGLCMKCGKDGHMAKDCKEKAIVRTIEHVIVNDVQTSSIVDDREDF